VKELSPETKNPFWKGIGRSVVEKLGATNHSQSLSGRADCGDE